MNLVDRFLQCGPLNEFCGFSIQAEDTMYNRYLNNLVFLGCTVSSGSLFIPVQVLGLELLASHLGHKLIRQNRARNLQHCTRKPG